MKGSQLILVVLLIFSAVGAGAETIQQILDRADKLYRSKTSVAEVEMKIANENWQRTLKLKMWTRGMKDTFIVIESPKKDAGIATLRKDKEMWNFFPKINKVLKVPSSMMMGSWMGSDFTNDDLVKESTFIEDYHSRFLDSKDPDYYLVEVKPKEGSVSVWEKILLKIEKRRTILVRQEFYDERGELARTMDLSEIKNMGGKVIPTIMTLTSHKKKGNQTVVRYLSAQFDGPLSESVFSRKNLQKRR